MTCGSRILEGYRPAYHATAVRRLLAEGAIIVGKTNLDEFAMGSSTEYSAYGPTRNPWDRTRCPGGSSGGSAAAVAAGLVPAALGSDTGGSVRQPAALCGVVGFRPTYGTVSRYGLTAFASSFDQIGPLTRTVRDAALFTEIMGGEDLRDSTTRPGGPPALLADLEAGVSGLRIGVPDAFFPPAVAPEVTRCVREGLDLLARSGATLVPLALPEMRGAVAAYYLAAMSEASANLARFDGMRYGPREAGDRPFESLMRTRGRRFGTEVRRRILLGVFALSEGYHEDYYLRARAARRRIRDALLRTFKGADLLAGPVSPVEAFPLGSRLDDPTRLYTCDQLTVPASLAGLPAVSVPCGLTKGGLPVGLQLTGPPCADGLVLRAARALEFVLPQKGPTNYAASLRGHSSPSEMENPGGEP